MSSRTHLTLDRWLDDLCRTTGAVLPDAAREQLAELLDEHYATAFALGCDEPNEWCMCWAAGIRFEPDVVPATAREVKPIGGGA